MVKNLSRYHREHEKYYSETPLADDRVKFLRTVRIIRRRAADPAFPP